MSRKFRIGNNLEIQWTVNLHNSDGTLVDLTSLNLGVQLLVGQKVYEVQNPTITANLITFLYPGASQQYDGPYIIKLYDKDNSVITYDVRNAFILTDTQWGAGSSYTPEDYVVEIETDINFVQVIHISGQKGDKGEKGDKGDKGDTGNDGQDGQNGYDGVDGIDGKDGKDGIDGQNGSDGEPGRSIRTTVFEEGIMYYDGNTLSPDGIYYLDVVADRAMAILEDSGSINYYICKATHESTAEEDLTDTNLWTPVANSGPIITPIVLAEKIKSGFIDVDDLTAKKVTVTDVDNNVVAKIGDMNDYTVDSITDKYPLWIGGATPATAVTRIDKDGKLTTTDIKASGSLESNKYEEEFEGHLKMDGGSITYDITGNDYGGTAVLGYRDAHDAALLTLLPTQDDPGLKIEGPENTTTHSLAVFRRGEITFQNGSYLRLEDNSYIELTGSTAIKGFKTPVERVTDTSTSIGGSTFANNYHTLIVYDTANVTLHVDSDPVTGCEFDIFCVYKDATLDLNGQAAFYINNGTLTEYNATAARSITLLQKHHYRLFYDGICWFITE